MSQYFTLLGNQISYDDAREDIYQLKFYEKNPRVHSNLIHTPPHTCTPQEKQGLILNQIRKEPSVQKLIKTIKKHGGVSEPLIVQNSTMEVLEGNSRLAASRILYEKENNQEYLTVPCRMVLLDESQIIALLHQQHVEGKTSWTPFDKAYSTYHAVIKRGVSIEDYANWSSESTRMINNRIDTIELMLDQNDGTILKRKDRFSYYEQILRSTKLKSAVDKYPDLKDYLLVSIKDEETPFTAPEMRDSIPQIAKKPKLLRKLIRGTLDFDQANELAKVSKPQQYLAKARRNLEQINSRSITKLEKNEKNALSIELRKCSQEINKIKKMVARSK